MTTATFGQLAARLSTMDGYPAWDKTLSEDYFAELNAIRDDIARQMVAGVRRRFDKRPSVQKLWEWSQDLAAPPVFDIKQLDRPFDASRALPAPEVSKAEAARVMAEVRARVAGMPQATAGDTYGLQFRNRETNVGQRTRPAYSEAVARRLAAERNEKWAHQETTVYRKGDEWPADLVRVELDTQPPAAPDHAFTTKRRKALSSRGR